MIASLGRIKGLKLAVLAAIFVFATGIALARFPVEEAGTGATPVSMQAVSIQPENDRQTVAANGIADVEKVEFGSIPGPISGHNGSADQIEPAALTLLGLGLVLFGVIKAIRHG